MKIKYKIDSGNCYVIAEAGLNHNGSIEIAKQLIDIASSSGADAVKFQKRNVDGLAIKSVLDAKDNRFPEFGSTYREIREHLEFNLEQFKELKSYSESKNIDFISTAFDIESVDFLEKLELQVYKIASHGMTNINLLKYLSKKNKPIIISTGMAEMSEIETAIEILSESSSDIYLMHCVSSYPTPMDQCNLKMIDVLKDKFNLPVGYSGHEIGYLPTTVAVSRGAQLVERHYTIDNKMVGFDHKLSLEPDEFSNMIKDIRNIKLNIGDGKKAVSDIEMVTRNKYHVSLVSSRLIKANEIINKEMITYKNPGNGIPPKDLSKILGKTIKTTLAKDELFDWNMFE